MVTPQGIQTALDQITSNNVSPPANAAVLEHNPILASVEGDFIPPPCAPIIHQLFDSLSVDVLGIAPHDPMTG